MRFLQTGNMYISFSTQVPLISVIWWNSCFITFKFFIESGMNKRRDLNIQTVEILKNCLKGGNRGLSIKRHVFSFSDFSDFQLIDSCLFILASIGFCFQVFVWIPYISNLTQISNWKWNCLKFKLDNRLQ